MQLLSILEAYGPEDLLLLLENERNRRKRAYNLFMSTTVHVQINQAVDPRLIVAEDAEEKDGELVIKSVDGTIAGKFQLATIAGWWIVREAKSSLDLTLLTHDEFDTFSRLAAKATKKPQPASGGDS